MLGFISGKFFFFLQVKKTVPDDIESYHVCITCEDDGVPAASLSQCYDLHIGEDANPPLDILLNKTEIEENVDPQILGALTVINAVTGRTIEPVGLEVSVRISRA